MIIPYELFDDGGIECKTFTICYSKGITTCELDYIKDKFNAEVKYRIVKAIEEGKRYITLDENDNEYGVVEISWD